MKSRFQQVSWVIAAAAVWAGAGCSEVAGTGRKQIMLVSTSQEMALGLQAYQEVLASEKLSSDARMTAIVQRVGRRIAAVADRPDFEWEFNLIESDQVNAFCLPGGKIAVYTGILPVMKNEAGMAAVMGHEVAHAVARHGGERMSQHMAKGVVMEAVSMGLGGASAETRSFTMAALGVGANVGVMLPYSRTHELEADQMGLGYMAKAGYDPSEAVRLWERMAEASAGGGPEFLSTHPAEENRIAQFEELMENAQEQYRNAPEKFGLGETW